MPVETSVALLIDGGEVCNRISIGRSKFHQMIRGGQFPLKPIRLGRAVRFDAGELSRWVAAGCPNADRWRAMQTLVTRKTM